MSDGPDALQRFCPPGASHSSSDLSIRGWSVRALAEKYGTPLFIYDLDDVRTRLHQVRRALPAFRIFYSIKANPAPAIIRLLRQESIGMEIASHGELDLVTRCGVAMRDVRFAGPGKSRTEIREAVARGIGALHVESEGELERCLTYARDLRTRARISLRVNGRETRGVYREEMASQESPFGVDERDVPRLVRRIVSSPHADFIGYHMHFASQVLNARAVLTHFARMLAIVIEATSRVEVEPQEVVFGAGLGVPTAGNERELRLSAVAREIRARCKRLAFRVRPRLCIELGRFLVARSGLLVTRVRDAKQTGGRTVVVVDGGANAFARRLITGVEHRSVVLCSGGGARKRGVYTIVGPLCTPLDVVRSRAFGVLPEEGDLVVLFVAGAYGRSMALTQFLGHKSAAETFITGVHGRG